MFLKVCGKSAVAREKLVILTKGILVAPERES